MSTEIIPFDATGGGQLPAHLASVFGDQGNIAPRQQIDQLSYRGKVWRRIVNGEETQLTRPSQDIPNTTEPVPVVQVIILDHNKQRSRSFFEGNYEEGKNAKPRCYSGDGVKPDASVKDPISPTCASCPNAVKGSKITESGKQTTACAPFKRVAIVPSANVGGHPPLLLKLAQTSIWDGNNPEEAHGWYAWDNYLDMLRARGAKHTAMVETRVKFDLSVAYPKLLFSAARWLAPEEAVAASKFMKDKAEAIETIINGAGDTDGVMGQTAGAVPASGTTTDNSATAGPAVDKPVATPAPTQAPAATPAPAPAAAKTPKKPPAAPKAQPEMKVTKKIDLSKTDGFSLEQMLEAGWTEQALVEAGMLLIVEEPVAPKAPPKPPAAPKAPPKPPAAPAPAPVDDGGFGASAPAPQQAAAAPSPAPAGEGIPAGLGALLDEWDDNEAT